MNKLPKVISEGKIDLGGTEITVQVLDDGRRVIPEEDMKKALALLGLTLEDLDMLIKGRYLE